MPPPDTVMDVLRLFSVLFCWAAQVTVPFPEPLSGVAVMKLFLINLQFYCVINANIGNFFTASIQRFAACP